MTEHIQSIKGKLELCKMKYLFTFNLPYKLSEFQKKKLKEVLEYTLNDTFPFLPKDIEK